MYEEMVFEKYAIGGGIAAIFYIEPVTTFDLDIFIILKQESKLISLTTIYDWLIKKGYKTEKEQIIIEGVPVQFIPVYNELVMDAVINAEKKEYGETDTFVISKEYLFALMLQTNRPKDRDRMHKFFEQVDFSENELKKILMKFQLTESYNKFKTN